MNADPRYTVADLPESGRFVVVDENSGKWILETHDENRAMRFAYRMNAKIAASAGQFCDVCGYAHAIEPTACY